MGERTNSRHQTSNATEKKRMLDFFLNNVRCFLCLEQFRDPRVLKCHHTFCHGCIQSYIDTICDEGIIECPLCDAETNTPENGADGLEKNYYFIVNKQEVGVTCNICGEREFAKAHCMECDQNFCESCLRSHGGMTATREHHIVSVGRNHLGGKLTRNLFCKTHDDEKLLYHCITCGELICRHCNMTNHKMHTSKYILDVSGSFREKLRSAITSDEYANFFLWLAERKREFSNEVKRCKTTEETAIDDVNRQAEIIHQLVDKAKKSLISKLSETIKGEVKPLKNQITTVDKNILSLSSVFLYAKNMTSQADDLALVDKSHSLLRKLEALKSDTSVPAVKHGDAVFYEKSDIDMDKITDLFGKISQGEPKDENGNKPSFLHGFESERDNSTISAILPLEDGRAWVAEGVEGLIQLYDATGRIHKTLHLGVQVDDIISGPDGGIIVSCNAAKEVRNIDQHLRVTPLVSTPYCARGLTLDKENGCLYICVTEKNAFFDHDDTHNNKVVKSMIGKKKRWELPDILEFSSNPTVEYPARAVVTRSGKIAISDWKRECITILDNTGHIESEYSAMSSKNSVNSFCPRGICCSPIDGRIVVADYNNSSIVQISESGDCFQYLLTKADGILKPWSVSIGLDGLLWVGTQTGSVRVFYLHNQEKDKTVNN